MHPRCAVAAVLLTAPFPVRAERMVASYYDAPAPHIAAHRTLPFGTRLILTNPRNGRSAEVVIRDRGPFVPGRSLDISRTRARELGFTRTGVVHLDARIVGR
jgi:rare lipoprotein A